MALFIQATNTTSTITLPDLDDTLEILPNVVVSASTGPAVAAQLGEVTVDVEGFVFGNDAFLDTTTKGFDAITIGATGTAVGIDTAIIIEGPESHILNLGVIESLDGSAIALKLGGEIDNAGTIAGQIDAINDDGDDLIANSGRISGVEDAIAESGGSNTINNTGTITSTSFGSAVYATEGHNIINNSGTIAGNGGGVLLDGSGDNYFDNSGKITTTFGPALDINGNYNQINNSGELDGQIYATGDDDTLNVTGTIFDGVVLAATTGVTSVTVGAAGLIEGGGDGVDLDVQGGQYDIKNDGEIVNPANNDGSPNQDTIVVAGAGVIVNSGKIESSATAILNVSIGPNKASLTNHGLISGGTGGISDSGGHSDAINNYGAIDATAAGADAIYGDATSLITLVNAGTIDGAVDLLDAGSSVANSGTIDGAVTLGGGNSSLVNTGLIDGNVTFSAGDDAFINKGRVIGNVTFSGNNNTYSGANGAVAGDIFGAGAKGTYIGGAEATTFVFSASGFGAGDVVTGGSNNDTLMFSGAGAITAYALKSVSGVETIDLANGTNAITLSNALVGSAYQATLRVNGGTGADTINASAVSTSTDMVIIDGGAGADVIDAGAAHDVFVYDVASDSAGAAYDTLSGVNFGHDTFNLGPALRTIPTIDAAVTSGTLSTTTFAANLTSDLAGHLTAHSAVLFTASAGTLSGDTFLVVNPTATAGYQSSADLVIRLAGATGTLAAANFT